MKKNKTEILLIYNTINKKVSSVHALNMKQLLNEEEVLTFGFDDFNKNMSNIMVQAKDLFVYIIDFN